MSNYANLIATMARARGLDPRAVLAIAYNESGIRPNAVGDNGTSFGPFQLHEGGALPSGRGLAWASSRPGLAYALDRMASVARGLRGQAAVSAISRGFERQADPAHEISVAMGWYQGHPGAAAGSGDPTMHLSGTGQAPAVAPGGGGRGGAGLIAALMANNASYAQTGMIGTTPNAAMMQFMGSGSPHLGGAPVPANGPASPVAQRALSFAKSAIGTPYVWGGESAKGYDCSGLVQAAMRAAGISVGRTTYQQIQHGAPVHWGQFKPGDLIFSDFEGTGQPTHVVIYMGNGKVIAAPHTGTTVQIENVNLFRDHFIGARRYF